MYNDESPQAWARRGALAPLDNVAVQCFCALVVAVERNIYALFS